MGLSGAPRACRWHFRLVRGTTVRFQGHHKPVKGHLRPSRDTTGLPGPRGTTGLARTPQACQGHHGPVRAHGHLRLVRGTLGLSGGRGTTVLPGARHRRPVRGTSGLAGAPVTTGLPRPDQRHHRPVRGTTGLAGPLEHHRSARPRVILPSCSRLPGNVPQNRVALISTASCLATG